MPVCGEHGVGFAAQQIGGGSVVRSVMNTELGFFYVVIDPACRFVAFAARDPDSNGIGTAYGGRLTAELSRELDAFLSLDAWSDGSRFELFVRDVVEFRPPTASPSYRGPIWERRRRGGSRRSRSDDGGNQVVAETTVRERRSLLCSRDASHVVVRLITDQGIHGGWGLGASAVPNAPDRGCQSENSAIRFSFPRRAGRERESDSVRFGSLTCLLSIVFAVGCGEPEPTSEGTAQKTCVTPDCCFSNDDCADGEYCEGEGACDSEGTCKLHVVIPCPIGVDPVTRIPHAPVCGCDGITYRGRCQANNSGTRIAHDGMCEASTCFSDDDCNEGEYCEGDGDGACDSLGRCKVISSTHAAWRLTLRRAS